jgi:hypothetical protein
MPVVPSNPPPIPRTVLDVISSALRLIGVLASGETPSAAEQADSLAVFQDMVDSWNAERLMIYTVPRLVFPLVSGQQVYTYGAQTIPPSFPPPDFNADRAPSIERMGIIFLGNEAQPLELPLQYLTTAQWQEIPVKNIQSSLPQYCWDDNAFPWRNLSFWPIPNTQVDITIYPWAVLTTPANLTTELAFPPGYQKALRYNLAVDLAMEFPGTSLQLIQGVAAIAQEAKSIVKTINTPIIDLRCDPAVVAGTELGLYNWISDMPAGR